MLQLVYLKTYDSVRKAREELGAYIYWYNHERRHSSLNKQRPWAVMSQKAGHGYVENAARLHTLSTPPTTTTPAFFIHKEKVKSALPSPQL